MRNCNGTRCAKLSLVIAIWLSLTCIAPLRAQTSDRSLQIVRERGTLIWAGDKEGGGPYVYPDAQDPQQLVGFEVEIAQAIADKLGVKSQFMQGQWDKLPELLLRGDADVVLNGYEWSPSRSQRFGCSVPYYIYELQLLGKRSSAPVAGWEEFLKLAGRSSPRIGVLGGSAAHDYLIEKYADRATIVQFEGSSEAMRAVELGTDGVQAVLQDWPIWRFYQSGFPQLQPIGTPVGRGYYVVLTRREDSELLRAINQSLIQMLTDGSLREILQRYGLWNETQAARGLQADPTGNFVMDYTEADSSAATAAATSFAAVRGWAVIGQRGALLARAAGVTVLLSVLAMPLAILMGLLLAIIRMFGWRWTSWLAQTYIEIVRGTPLVLQLYVLFFLLPELGVSIHAFWAAVVGLAINYSAYEAEIYRAGIQAVPRGQWEAATALGMGRWLTLRRVVLPQATRVVIPPVTNDFIALFKDTAVCSVITVVELSKEYSIHARSTGAIVELGILTALLYLAMSFPLSKLAGYLERRLGSQAA